MKTFRFLLGFCDPGTTKLRKMFPSLMQRAGGKFIGIPNIGQQECVDAPKLKGLKPLIAIATRTFLSSIAKSMNFVLKCFHASP
jgi:hypothetical protein